MVEAFDVDEAVFLENLNAAIQDKNMIMHLFRYGHFYYNVGLVFLHCANLFTTISEEEIVIFFRLLSSIFHLLSVWLLYIYAKRYFNKTTAIISASLLMVSSKTLLFYSQNLHPDTAQVFFVILAFFSMSLFLENPNWKRALFSSFLLGVCFGVKYVGIFILPIYFSLVFLMLKHPILFLSKKAKLTLVFVLSAIYIFCFSPTILSNYLSYEFNADSVLIKGFFIIQLGICALVTLNLALIFIKKDKYLLIDKTLISLVSAAIFIVGFALSSPYSFHQLNVLRILDNMTEMFTHGIHFSTDNAIESWIRAIVSSKTIPAPVLIILLGTPLIFLMTKKKNKHMWLIICWVCFFSIYLTIAVKLRNPHYIIPILPFIFILVGETVHAILLKLTDKIVFSGYIISLVILSYFGIAMFGFRNEIISSKTNSDELTAGLWIEEHIDPKKIILSDQYTYIPKPIEKIKFWALNDKKTQGTKHTYLLINNKAHNIYLDSTKADKYIAGVQVFMASYRFYTKLNVNTHESYTLIKDFGKVKLFKLTKPILTK